MSNNIEKKYPVPPFSLESAIEKVRKAEDAWNSRDPELVSKAYSIDSKWRNRNEFINGREEIAQFLTRKWKKESEYRLIKEIWVHGDYKIAVRFAYEWKDQETQKYYRSYGNENWKFNDQGLMIERHASINDLEITEDQRKFKWPQGRRPDDHPGLTELGL
ncbi:hypothetical protein DICPUDRAFT_40521 [Dictyostelium purpureum]|uniref:DUF1348 family protein n=1 Tax=Dictyostelium purpureum TaxID=5786 RepID=F0ZYB6_DICPU|nr:uncharacterized protein DICPUDRAFT_40521 [Dictyostelium purpureum]EGC31057.1 hypothetical protein DICPUDRAFT_40521 [Dictyostelium purpureum]|eukprot:XP_003292416.1 hypothetical protein DICPUDRAFT_40521 [Dictyostelium purpureum]